MEPGKLYLVESVTSNLFVGKCASIEGPHTVLLTDAAWIADTGRLHRFMKDGKADGMEVEPIGTRCIHWASWAPWPHKLFEEAI